MLRRLAVILVAVSVSGCPRDLALPGPPAPGTIQGRVVYAVPQTTEKKAAAGASVNVLGTSLGAVAGADGRFLVEGITSESGSLLIRADLDGDGQPDRQLLLAFSDIHAGQGRDVALGDVSIVENGSIHGRVLLSNIPQDSSALLGSVVFVPQGPFTQYTNSDGTFILGNLPAGTISLTFFRNGYAPQGVDGIALRAGEDFPVGDITLQASTVAPQNGSISGQLTFSPPTANAAAATVKAFLGDVAQSATVTGSGAFSMPSVAPGVYRVEASMTGYATAVVANLFVGSGQQVSLGIALARDGVTVEPTDAGAQNCVDGGPCTPDPCHVGKFVCVAGSPVCQPAGPVIDGHPCGDNQVCSGGQCVKVCIAGASCQPPSDPCKQGVTVCAADGTQTCVATTTTLPNGASCGRNEVCNGGACVSCVPNTVCNAANPCHSGLTDCSSGTQVCKDTGQALADGAQCGSNLYCNAGSCGACTPGISCDPAGFPCHTGATSCATGRPVCTDLGAAKTDGTSCGANQVCFAGSCNSCAQGQACTPTSNACHNGSIACGTGQPVCVDQQTSRAPGASCGAGHVCDGGGGCIACGQGASCTPLNPCHTGAIDCSSGAALCVDLNGNLTDGTTCGSGKVCSSGICTACASGSLCTPLNACHLGTTACGTGQPVCNDTGTSLADGAICGPNQVCFQGACGSCTTGAPCTPAGTPDACKVYGIACGSGQPVCGVAGNQPDATPCGSGMICRGGSCQTSTLQIAVVSGGGQHALPNQPLPLANPLVVEIADLGGTGQAGHTVSITPPPGAQATPASATTDSNGNASFALTLGRAAGDQIFTIAAADAFPTTATVTETADPLTDGTVIPLVNTSHASGDSPLGGPGPSTRLNQMGGIAVASTGDIYFSDNHNCRVNKLTTAGVVVPVAGLPPPQTTCGYSGDTGPATSARLFYPSGLALDESNGRLYIAEYQNSVVRVVDLARGLIDTFAGTTDSSVPDVQPYGDGGAARSAKIDNPDWVALGPERPNPAVYVTDLGHRMVRRIDGNDGTISTVLRPGSCSSSLALVDLFSSNFGSGIAFDGEGHLFVSARFCGTQTGTTGTINGIARLQPDGSLVLVAGSVSGGLGAGSALGAGFSEAPYIAFDNAKNGAGTVKNNLYFAVPASHVVGRIDGASGELRVIGGTVGAGGAAGDFGPAASARFNYPQALAFAPNGRDLIVSEFYDGSIRLIANAGSQDASSASIQVSGSSGRSGYVDQLTTPPLQALLQDGTGTLLAGYPVAFSVDPGGWVSTAVARTSLAGIAAVSARPGLAVGTYGVLASFNDIHGDPVTGSPVPFTLNAGPPVGLVFTAVNDAHTFGTPALTQTGPGTTFTIGSPRGLAAASDGSLYFSDNNWFIYRMDPSGVVRRIAGIGNSYSGDGGAALSAGMNPWGLWLDEPGGQLYFADQSVGRIRVIDLASGVVSTYAGPAASPPFYLPTRVAIAGGYLYTGDYNTTTGLGLRRIKIDPNPANRAIEAVLVQGSTQALLTPSSTSCNDQPTFSYCYSDPGCQVAAEPAAPGRLYVSALFCGKDFNNGGNTSAPPAIVRIETDGSLTRIAGHVLNALGSGTLAGDAGFPAGYPPMIRFDANGNLWIAAGSQVGYFAPALGPDLKMDVNVNSVFTQVGSGPPASIQPGQYDTVPNAFFPAPVDLAFLNGSGGTHVVVADNLASFTSYSLRVIW